MPDEANHLILGAAGEEAAVSYLTGLGWRINARNWRPRGAASGLELDIVAIDADTLVFVEVKTRNVRQVSGGTLGISRPSGLSGTEEKDEGIPVYAAFSKSKQGRLLRAARHFLNYTGQWDTPCRFDLICVERTPRGELRLEHHDNVLEFWHTVDSGHSPWQPW